MDERSIPALAVVGMAGRFPAGEGLDGFWALLEQGRSAVRSLSEQELREAGVDEALIANPSYVKCCIPLEGADLFDAAFFGYSPRQAANIDPQQRLFLECAWEALERAGYGAIPPRLTAAVFGGSGFNGYLARSLSVDFASDPENALQSTIDAGKDFMTGRVAYKLGLTGPAITVQTACSTSLVAVHLAGQSLLSYECDLAVAGGASVELPPHTGYLHVEGSIQSRDGACRAFEADASGTLRGNGAAVVVLRRLADAEADGDRVLAIIRSTVVNNDGSRKVGFTAPGVEAQVRLLRTGLELAGLSPADIDFLESHGTATALGDAIELTALQEVYSSRRGRRKPCVLGAVKTNIGHTDTAAGVAGLIKTVLSLQHKVYVPNAGFRRPNALLAAEESVFRICSALEPWPAEAGRPRRAAVSSFGVGGTNAHVIVEEAPDAPAQSAAPQAELLPISARTPAALEQSCSNLAAHLDANELTVADVAFTLQVGRRTLDHRRFVVGADRNAIAVALRTPSARQALASPSQRPVIFLFPGQGAQRPGMLADLYATDREVAEQVDRCAKTVLDLQGHDLRKVLCHRSGSTELDIDDTSVTQPALFVTEYCLAQFWIRQGLSPAAVLGHSLGEYAAACTAGVLALDDALRLVVYRARASRELLDGVMVAVHLPEGDVERLLTPAVQITAINASRQCVVSGASHAMQAFMARLDASAVGFQRLPVSKPFHTDAAAPLAERMLDMARQLPLAPPRVPWISSTTAARVSDAESRNPEHWARHVLEPVRFAAALRALDGWKSNVLLEVGPGRVLTGLARHERPASPVFASLPTGARAARADLLQTLGEMWLAGAAIDFATQSRRDRRRVDLPVHPLSRSSYVKGRQSSGGSRPQRTSNARLAPERWFNLPSWQRSAFPAAGPLDASAGAWLLVRDEQNFAASLAQKLEAAGQDVIVDSPGHVGETFGRLDREGRRVGRIIHCATLSESGAKPCVDGLSLPEAVSSLMQIARAASERSKSLPLSMLIATNRLHDISGYERPFPEKAALQALCRCIAQEVPETRCVVADLPPPGEARPFTTLYARYEDKLLAEIENGGDPAVAYRRDWRFIETYTTAPLDGGARPLRDLIRGGLYVITGGLGRLGVALGERLAREFQARLLLIGRRAPSDGTSLVRMQAHGADVMTAVADVSDAVALSDAIAHAEQRFGPVRGVFHLAADLAHRSRRCRVAALREEDLQAQLRPKCAGLVALLEALGTRRIDFGIAFSSTSAVLGGVGYGAYAAANAVLDSMISSRADDRLEPWTSVNWDGWQVPGGESDPYVIGVEEGLDALLRVCRFGDAPQMVVSATPLQPRFDTWVRMKQPARSQRSLPTAPPVAEENAIVETSKVAPRSGLERQIAEMWQELLGIDTVGVTENFLDLGGDSLIGVRVTSRINEVFRVSLTPASLLGQNSTVEALSRDIVRALAEKASVSAEAANSS